MQIQEELLTAVGKYRRLARLNYYLSFILYATSVLASITATTMALSGDFSGPVQAIAAAIPGAALLIGSTFRFNERSNWHYNKKNHLNALYRLTVTQAAGTSAPEIAEKWNKIDQIMESSWPGFGGISGGQSNSQRI
jgi:hypothetical protein